MISYLFPSSRPDRLLPPDFFSGAAFISVFLLVFSGCHYYEEYRVLKSTADLQDEKAELLKAYRLCLAKHQEDPPRAKELCGPYTQSLREIEVKHQGGR